MIGAGGLGSPIAMYLAAAGIGTLGVVDFDRVDVSNLQRQILHTDGDVGRPKVESAVEHLRAINPTIDVVGHDTLLFSTNVFDVLAREQHSTVRGPRSSPVWKTSAKKLAG